MALMSIVRFIRFGEKELDTQVRGKYASNLILVGRVTGHGSREKSSRRWCASFTAAPSMEWGAGSIVLKIELIHG
jgi:hypothetical protein